MAITVTLVGKGVRGLPDLPEKMEVPEESTLASFLQGLAPFQSTSGSRQPGVGNAIVLLNGRYVAATALDATILKDGDRVEVIPLVVGG
ncbi:MAG: MoaD/ThiS family protein [Thermoleophilia bacterium]|nr:MoaD/ThiS family protein [Thermoleophilia bacterium]